MTRHTPLLAHALDNALTGRSEPLDRAGPWDRAADLLSKRDYAGFDALLSEFRGADPALALRAKPVSRLGAPRFDQGEGEQS